ncbi:MAG: iron complex transport system substrate-binding protein [Sulfurimonas sp.]
MYPKIYEGQENMKYILLFLITINILNANEIIRCEDYKKISNYTVGKSPPSNMMLQTIREYKFPKKISKKDDAFKKLSGIESLLEKKVDLVVLYNSSGNYANLASKLQKVNIDSCSINLTSIYDYIDGYRTLGRIMNKEDRANELSEYIEKKLKYVKSIEESIPLEKRVTVYYAKRSNGLESDCKDSVHSEVIELVGGINPVECNELKNTHVNINLEKLLMLNPDVIITSSKDFYKKIFKESKYRYLKAVKEKRVYLVPKKPINWIDNPPSFLKILGALWLGQALYPQYYQYDLKTQKKEFSKLFLKQGK